MNLENNPDLIAKDWIINPRRSGILLRGSRVDKETRQPFAEFLKWLRTQYEFPVRVPVYLFPSSYLITQDGHEVNGSFVAPFTPSEEPLIRIAAGDLASQIREHGRIEAVGTHLCTLAHECVHYWQWVDTGEIWERGVRVKSRGIIDRYYEESGRWF